MDLRSAAKYFKTRWQATADTEWKAEATRRRAERTRDAQGRFQSQKTVDDLTKNAAKTGSQTSGKSSVFGENQPKTANDTQSPVEAEKLRKQRLAREQAVLSTYLGQVLEILESVPQTGDVKNTRKVLVDLLKAKSIEADKFLDFDKQLDALAKNNGTVKKQIKKTRAGQRERDADIWERVDAELERLRDLEAKGQKLEFSDKLVGSTLSVFESFLGPAGPLFRAGRDIYEEHKESIKPLFAKAAEIPKMMKARARVLRKAWRAAEVRFTRMFPKLSGAMGKFADKLKNLGDQGRSIWSRVKGKGKWGKIASVASNVWNFMGTELGKGATMLGAAGLMSLFGGKKDKDKDESSLFSMKTVTSLVHAAADGLGKAFDGVRNSIVSSWNSMLSWANTQFTAMTNLFDAGSVQSRIAKDYLEEKRDIIWDAMTQWFSDVWAKIKGLVPESVKRALGWARTQAGRVVDAVKDTAAGKAVANASSTISRNVGKIVDRQGGDGREKIAVAKPVDGNTVAMGQKAVKVVSGVDMGGLNHGLVQNFYAMAGEYYAATGRTIYVNSGARDTQQQAALYAANPSKAARPGYSMHEYGLAIDINSREANEMERMGLFAKYGFVRPISSEPWHLEPLGIQGMKSAIRRGKADIDVATNARPTQDTEGAAGASASASSKATTVAQPGDLGKASPQMERHMASLGLNTTPASSSVLPPTLAAGATNTTQTPLAEKSSAAISTGVYPAASFVRMEASTPRMPEDYKRVTSNSKQTVAPTVGAPEPEKVTPHGNRGASQVSTNKIGFYLGDMGMLTMNLGIGA